MASKKPKTKPTTGKKDGSGKKKPKPSLNKLLGKKK